MNLQSYPIDELILGVNKHLERCGQIPFSHQLECKSRLESLHNDFIKLKEHLTEQYHIANVNYKKSEKGQNKKYYLGRLQIASNSLDLIETFNFVNSNCT